MAPRPEVILVTGCTTGGIGWHVASQLASRGAVVYATARRVTAMEGLEARGCRLLALDVTKPDTIKAAVNKIIADNGRIDGAPRVPPGRHAPACWTFDRVLVATSLLLLLLLLLARVMVVVVAAMLPSPCRRSVPTRARRPPPRHPRRQQQWS